MPTRLVTLTCAGCSAPVTVPADVRQFTCSHCGSSLRVEHSGGAVFTRELERLSSDVERLKLLEERRRLIAERGTLAAMAQTGVNAGTGTAVAIGLTVAALLVAFVSSLLAKGGRPDRPVAPVPSSVSDDWFLNDFPKPTRVREPSAFSRPGVGSVLAVGLPLLVIVGLAFAMNASYAKTPDNRTVPDPSSRLRRVNGRLSAIDARLAELTQAGRTVP